MAGITTGSSLSSSASLLLATLLCMALCHPVGAWDEDENEFRLEGAVQKSLTESTSVRLTQQDRWRDGGHFYSHTDAYAQYDFPTAWSVGVAYRYIDKERQNHQWKPDHQVYLNLIHTAPFWAVCFKNRLRLVYTDRYGAADDTPDVRYRLDLFPEKKYTPLKLSPYVAPELFYELEEDYLYRARISAGLKASAKWLGLDLYIGQQRDQGPQHPWTEKYIIGLAACIKF
jgi:hypothetical protein